MKKEPFTPNNFYLIQNSSNNNERLFLEDRNYQYFLTLMYRHVSKIANLKACCLYENKFELLIRIKEIDEIQDKYKEKIHLPLSNFFNAYCKGMNKVYGRSGSLFREHFFRRAIASEEIETTLFQLQMNGRHAVHYFASSQNIYFG